MPTNRVLIFSQVPQGVPIPGQDLKVVEKEGPHPTSTSPPPGGFIAQSMYVSFDPSMRMRMTTPDKPNVFPPYPIGTALTSACIVKVLVVDSSLSTFKPGDLLLRNGPVQEYHTVTSNEVPQFTPLPSNPFGLEPSVFLGALGSTGLVAYAGLYHFVKPKRGETILISAASGAIGHLLGQLAKREGMTVLGIVGSDEKVDILIRKLNFDGAVNYKKGDLHKSLKELAPDGIDVYFDNVGGQVLEAAIEILNQNGRIISCGAASQYNLPIEKSYGIRNTFLIISKTLTWTGLASRPGTWMLAYEEERQKNMQQWIHDGTMKPLNSFTYGFENSADGVVDLLKGKNVGKAILNLADTVNEL